MKTRFLLFSFFLSLFASNSYAQNDFNVSEITVINLGDGRMLFRSKSDEKPLSGEHRIIDGYRTEYILAQFADGMYNGSYQQFKHNKLIEKGTYREGRRNGKFTEYFGDGESVKSEKYFTAGKLDGVLKTFYTNGKTESEIGYKNGLEHGIERRYDYQTGKLKTDAFYVDGKPEGKQTRYISSNVGDYIQVSNYSKGLQTGDYSETFVNGSVRVKGKYKEGKKEGLWTEYRKDGKPNNETTYKNGEMNGESKVYYTDGSVEKIINYVNGEKNGIVKEFHYDSGKPKSEYTYADDRKEGKYKLYYDNGTLREEGRCERGSEVYSKEYYRNGKLKEVRERTSRGWSTIESYDQDGKQR